MEMFGAALRAYPCQARAEIFICWGAIKERLAQGAQIKTRSTNQQNRMATPFDLFDLFNCGAGPVSCRKIHPWGDKVDQVMRHAATLCQRRPPLVVA